MSTPATFSACPTSMGRGEASHLDGVQGQLNNCTLLWGQALGFFSYHVVLDGWREGSGGQSRPHIGDLLVYGTHPCKTLRSGTAGLSFHHGIWYPACDWNMAGN